MGWKLEENTDEIAAVDTQITVPLNYKVVLLNDDFTTKDFVVGILESVFHKTAVEADAIMESVHTKGSAVIGIYSYDIASTLSSIVIRNARKNGFPLRCELEVA